MVAPALFASVLFGSLAEPPACSGHERLGLKGHPSRPSPGSPHIVARVGEDDHGGSCVI